MLTPPENRIVADVDFSELEAKVAASFDLEESTDTDDEPVVEVKKDYYFTFAQSSELRKHYIIFHDTHANARERMVAIFGSRWAFQYDDATKVGIDRFGLKCIGKF